MYVTTLASALGGILASLQQIGPLPEGVDYPTTGEHLRQALTIHANQTGSASNFDLAGWLRGNYPSIVIPTGSFATQAIAAVYTAGGFVEGYVPDAQTQAEAVVEETMDAASATRRESFGDPEE